MGWEEGARRMLFAPTSRCLGAGARRCFFGVFTVFQGGRSGGEHEATPPAPRGLP